MAAPLAPEETPLLPEHEEAEETSSTDRVVINVGGIRHECYLSTVQNFPDTRLYWIAEMTKKMGDFDPETSEFFFDRHPGCFGNILNYCRTGELHCPNDVCGPLFEKELAFWGVDELQMEPCCWGKYSKHREAHKHLKMPDDEEVVETNEDESEMLLEYSGMWSKLYHLSISYRPRIWALLEKPNSSKYARFFSCIMVVVIMLSIITFCVQTIEGYRERYHDVWIRAEYFYCVFFTVEMLLRIATCPNYKKFCKSALTWADMISTVQFHLELLLHDDQFSFLLVFRLLRIFRLFRYFHMMQCMQVFAQTMQASASEILMLPMVMVVPMVIFSTLVYFAEKHTAQQTDLDKSIPDTFWWAVITMTTVGYGDVSPVSVYGKLVGALCACTGVLIVALPISVIGSNFNLYYSYAQARMRLPKKNPKIMLADTSLVREVSGVKGDRESRDATRHCAEKNKELPRSVSCYAISPPLNHTSSRRLALSSPSLTRISRTSLSKEVSESAPEEIAKPLEEPQLTLPMLTMSKVLAKRMSSAFRGSKDGVGKASCKNKAQVSFLREEKQNGVTPYRYELEEHPVDGNDMSSNNNNNNEIVEELIGDCNTTKQRRTGTCHPTEGAVNVARKIESSSMKKIVHMDLRQVGTKTLSASQRRQRRRKISTESPVGVTTETTPRIGRRESLVSDASQWRDVALNRLRAHSQLQTNVSATSSATSFDTLRGRVASMSSFDRVQPPFERNSDSSSSISSFCNLNRSSNDGLMRALSEEDESVMETREVLA